MSDTLTKEQCLRRTLFGVGDPRDRTEDGEIRKACHTFDEAVKEWERLHELEPEVSFYITGLNHGIIAHFTDVRDLFAQPQGTFECPICLLSTPHTHTAQEVLDHRTYEAEAFQRRQRRRAEIRAIASHIERTYG